MPYKFYFKHQKSDFKNSLGFFHGRESIANFDFLELEDLEDEPKIY